ncbi:MAG: response regulator, partial [Pseudomonadota bacterium]
MKVLIVDDEKDICKYLQRELRKEGCEVEYTTSPLDLIGRLSDAAKGEKPYELLLLDIRMPKRGGFELMKDIRDARLDPDVIIITGYGDEDKAIEAIHLGAVDYLRKPISLEELHTAIFRVEQKRARKQEQALIHSILVVDDEQELCARIKRELENERYQVGVGYDGAEGLEYFKNNRVDIVITDIKMPVMDGLEMLEKCREIRNNFRSIVITGFGDHEKAIRALKFGAFDYLRKPISIGELITVTESAVDHLMIKRGLLAHARQVEIEAALKTRYAARLKREKHFSDNIINTIPDSLLVLDKDLRIKRANRSFYETFQTETEKVIGTRITEIFGDENSRLSSEL